MTLIGEAVFARCLSSIREERGRASKQIEGPNAHFQGDKKAFIDKLEQVLIPLVCWDGADCRLCMRVNSSRTLRGSC